MARPPAPNHYLFTVAMSTLTKRNLIADITNKLSHRELTQTLVTEIVDQFMDSVTEQLCLGEKVIKAIQSVDKVKSVTQWVGRAQNGADTFGMHYSEIEVEIGPLAASDQKAVLDAIRNKLTTVDGKPGVAPFPGVSFAINTFLAERIEETVSGYAAEFVIEIFGQDLDLLDRDANVLAQAIAQINQKVAQEFAELMHQRLYDLMKTQDPKAVFDYVHAEVLQEAAKEVAEYQAQLFQALASGNKELARIAEAMIKESQHDLIHFVNEATQNAPAGAEPYTSAFKTSFNTALQNFEMIRAAMADSFVNFEKSMEGVSQFSATQKNSTAPPAEMQKKRMNILFLVSGSLRLSLSGVFD